MLIEQYLLMIKALYLTGYFKQTPDVLTVLSISAVDEKE
jgi:hypothetical protein